MHITRREAMRFGLLSAAGLLVSERLPGCLWADSARSAKAKSIIQIWMWGGPSHLDTFDPKPAAGYDYCGPLRQADSHERKRHSNQ